MSKSGTLEHDAKFLEYAKIKKPGNAMVAMLARAHAEIDRLKARDMNATITLAYDDGDNPFAREELKIVDVGVADNGYVVESKVLAELQHRIKGLES